MYGKPHHDKYPHKRRINDVFMEYLGEINKLSSGNTRIHNLIIHLRNEMYGVIDEIYQQLSIELQHDIKIESTRRKPITSRHDIEILSYQQPCIICQEKRGTNRCHIIPREKSGANSEDNMIYLCPTHHFLFDQRKLSHEEFNKIDVSKKASDSIDYFIKVITKQHETYWKIEL